VEAEAPRFEILVKFLHYYHRGSNFVQVSKRAKVFDCGLVVGFCCFGLSRVPPNLVVSTFDLYLGLPQSIALIPTDAFESRRVILVWTSVCAILGFCSRPEIVPSVVQSVPVNVVNLMSRIYTGTFSHDPM
jgi:hypothetical protein